MKNPLFILLLAGIVILGGIAYFGISQYQNYQQKSVETERQIKELVEAQQEKEQQLEEESEQQSLNIDALSKELEALKGKEPKIVTKTVVKEVSTQTISTELEIEKCKAKLSEGVPMEDIVAEVNTVFRSFWEDLKVRQTENLNQFLQCIEIAEQVSGDEFCRNIAQQNMDATDETKNNLETQQEKLLNDLIKQQQQTNYQDCLNLI